MSLLALNLRTSVLTDGTASWSSNSLSGFTSVSGTTLTDGTASFNAGSITGLTNVNSVTAAELSQLETIGATTISSAQWGYLGAMDQDVATTSSPTFAAPLLKTSLIIEDPGVGEFTWTLQAPTLAASYVLTLPVDDGTSGQVLITDGSGVLSWASNYGTVFSDDVFAIQDNVDSTKQIQFQASGITTETIRLITMPDANVDLTNAGLMNQSVATTASVSFASITDGTATLTSGAITGLVSATDGTASWSTNSLSGFTSISGTTLTDGTASLSSGAITGLVSATDGTASWSTNSLSGFTSISGTTLTDGTASMNSGRLTAGITTNSGFIRKITAVTEAVTLDATYHIVDVSTTAAGYAITLPSAAAQAGLEYTFIYSSNGGAFTVTITCAGSDTIDDGTTTTLALVSTHDRVKLVSLGGTVWYTNV